MAEKRICVLTVEPLEERRLLSATFPGMPWAPLVPGRNGSAGEVVVSVSPAVRPEGSSDASPLQVHVGIVGLAGPERGLVVDPLALEGAVVVPIDGRRLNGPPLAYGGRDGFLRQELFNTRRPALVFELNVPSVSWKVVGADAEMAVWASVTRSIREYPQSTAEVVLSQTPIGDPSVSFEPRSGQVDGKELSVKAQDAFQAQPLNVPTDRRGLVRLDGTTSPGPAAFESVRPLVSAPNGFPVALSRAVTLTEGEHLRLSEAGVFVHEVHRDGSSAGELAVVDTTAHRQLPVETTPSFADPVQPLEELAPQDWTSVLPQYAGLVTNVLPIDVKSIESDVKEFFDRIDELGVAVPGTRGDLLFGSGLLAAATAMAIEIARRQVHRRAQAATADARPTRPNWLLPSDRD